MAQDMMQTTPEGRARAAMDSLAPVIEEGAMAVDELAGAAAPVGRYSRKRLAAAAKVLNQIFKIAGVDVVIEDTFEDIKDQPLPDPIVRGLLGVKSTIDAFAAEMPEEMPEEIFELSQIVSDSELAFATAQLSQLFKNKEFKKFLRSEEPMIQLGDEEEEGEEEVPEREEPMTDDQVESEELDILGML